MEQQTREETKLANRTKQGRGRTVLVALILHTGSVIVLCDCSCRQVGTVVNQQLEELRELVAFFQCQIDGFLRGQRHLVFDDV